MSQPVLRSVHIGVGHRGRWPVRLVAASDRWRPVALVDIHDELLAEAREATELGQDACFRRPADAFAAVDADAAIICTPTEYHHTFAREAMDAGLHVLVEKGMSNRWQRALSMVHKAEETGLRLCVAQQYRYRPVERQLQELVAGGDVGPVAFFDLIHHRHRPEPRTLDYPGSVLWDMGCHHFDLLLAMFGLPDKVHGRLFHTPWSRYADPTGIAACLDWHDGPHGLYELTFDARTSAYGLRLETEAGTLFGAGEVRLVTAGGADETTFSLPGGPSAEAHVLEGFYNYITVGEEPPISGRRNLAVMALCEALLRAHDQGQAQEPARLLEGTPYPDPAGGKLT